MRVATSNEPEAPYAPPGPYRVIRRLPADEFRRWSYHLASQVDGHERVVPERYLTPLPQLASAMADGRDPAGRPRAGAAPDAGAMMAAGARAQDGPRFPAWGAVPA